ncbi:MAG: transposase [Verrucomicrobiota bacterium]
MGSIKYGSAKFIEVGGFDQGALLLRELELRTGTIRALAGCFRDERDPDLIEHSVEELLRQRSGALAIRYEDLNYHDSLRHDPPEALQNRRHSETSLRLSVSSRLRGAPIRMISHGSGKIFRLGLSSKTEALRPPTNPPL